MFVLLVVLRANFVLLSAIPIVMGMADSEALCYAMNLMHFQLPKERYRDDGGSFTSK